MPPATFMHPVQAAGTRVSAHHQPATVAEALELLAADPEARPVAGGTDLLLELARGEHPHTAALVDLTTIPGLHGIELAGDRLVLGPLVTHNQVVGSPLAVDRALPLAQACLEVGSPQLRNRATVVGNLVTASPANDTISALLALQAELTLTSLSGDRVVGLADFYDGFRSTAIAPGELVTKVTLRALAQHERGLFVKLGLRRAQAISVVHAAIVLDFDGPIVSGAAVALGSVAPVVIASPAAEAALRGRALDDDTIAAAATGAQADASPIDDIRATGDYRAATTGVIVRRALQVLRDGRERSSWPLRPPLLVSEPTPSPEPAGESGLKFTAADEISATVNGRPLSAPGAVGVTLLDWLREEAHEAGSSSLRGTQEGCAEGECGACTVRLDGAAVMSCLVPAAQAHGSEVTTIEGLADGEGGQLHPLQRAFVDCFAVQCGFCIPGFIMAGASLLEEVPEPDDDQIRAGLAGNLCRCTGYYKIIEAVRQAGGRGET